MFELNRKLTPREKLFLILAGGVVGMTFWKTISLGILPYSSESMGSAIEDYIASAGLLIGIILALGNMKNPLKALFFGGSAIGAIGIQLHGRNIFIFMFSMVAIYYLFVWLLKKVDVDFDKPGV